MKNVKYLSDGRKVVVVGQLNSAETIVQEVFISGDNEIPSGENFVVKSLHDAPVLSWKEKKLAEIEENYEHAKRKFEQESRGLRKKIEAHRELVREIVKTSKALQDIEAAAPDLIKFLAGEITHVVVSRYTRYEILPLAEAVSNDRGSYHEHIKLVTLCGRSDGSLEFRLHRYSDGSGSDSYSMIPCTSETDAKKVLEKIIVERIENKGADKTMIAAKEKYDLSVPSSSQIAEYNAMLVDGIRKSIDQSKKQIEEKEKEIERLLSGDKS